jgi:hypothetical protein
MPRKNFQIADTSHQAGEGGTGRREAKSDLRFGVNKKFPHDYRTPAANSRGALASVLFLLCSALLCSGPVAHPVSETAVKRRNVSPPLPETFHPLGWPCGLNCL